MTTFSKGNISDFFPENTHQRIHRVARKSSTSNMQAESEDDFRMR